MLVVTKFTLLREVCGKADNTEYIVLFCLFSFV